MSSVSAPESQRSFSFVVSLNYASTSKVTVKFATANGTATSGRNGDYMATSGTLTFNPGETSKVVT
ncbi:MAG: Calx-beta domain-containing protein, partial [bacterium]